MGTLGTKIEASSSIFEEFQLNIRQNDGQASL